MSVLEIVAGSVLLASCIMIIAVVLSQEAKGQGLSSVLTGSQQMSSDSRSHAKEARQVRITTVSAVLLFVLTVLVNVFTVMARK